MIQGTDQDYYVAKTVLGGVKGRLLIPQGAWNIRVNAYAAIDYTVGYVARVNGAPAWDYSGLQGLSDDVWNGAAWERDNQGTIAAAAVDDWQCRNRGGHSLIITSNIAQSQATLIPCWLYLLPIAARGTWSKLEIYFNINKTGWMDWDWNKAHAPVVTYPAGPKFITADGVPPVPGPVDPPEPPNPFPPFDPPDPTPEPVAKRGDLIFQTMNWVGPADQGFLQQSYKDFFQRAALESGVYGGIFNRTTWDHTDGYFNDGVPHFWTHVALAETDLTELPAVKDVEYVVVRLKPVFVEGGTVDLGAAVNKYTEVSKGPDFRYGQPFVGIFIHWLKSLKPDHFTGLPIFMDRLMVQLGINFRNIDTRAFQCSLMPVGYRDMDNPNFWTRDFDCSSLVMWCLMLGWHKKDPNVGAIFASSYEYVGAVDCVSPGILAAWLVENELADVIGA